MGLIRQYGLRSGGGGLGWARAADGRCDADKMQRHERRRWWLKMMGAACARRRQRHDLKHRVLEHGDAGLGSQATFDGQLSLLAISYLSFSVGCSLV